MTNYKELEIWKVSMDLATDLYKITASYPQEEERELITETRRASTLILSNIAEALSLEDAKECERYLSKARGLGYKLEAFIRVANMTKILSDEQFTSLNGQLSAALILIDKLIGQQEQKVA